MLFPKRVYVGSTLILDRAYVCRGYFPDLLTEKWDEYDEKFGSENERPDFYDENQLFAIIMLENGGTDLEHTELKNWEEACDVFWQVALALAKGEREREFEVRSLVFLTVPRS
jgi:hypothetical protein